MHDALQRQGEGSLWLWRQGASRSVADGPLCGQLCGRPHQPDPQHDPKTQGEFGLYRAVRSGSVLESLSSSRTHSTYSSAGLVSSASLTSNSWRIEGGNTMKGWREWGLNGLCLVFLQVLEVCDSERWCCGHLLLLGVIFVTVLRVIHKQDGFGWSATRKKSSAASGVSSVCVNKIPAQRMHLKKIQTHSQVHLFVHKVVNFCSTPLGHI